MESPGLLDQDCQGLAVERRLGSGWGWGCRPGMG